MLMHIFDHISAFKLPSGFAGVALTIGNFDGCHVGHQELIKSACQLAGERNLFSLVLTFDPHPQTFFQGNRTPEERLFTLPQKLRAFAELGIAGVCVQPFDVNLAHTTHHQFYHQVIKASLQAKAIVVGENFYFGAQRTGDINFLQEACQSDGIHLQIATYAQFDQKPTSSSRVRRLLKDGDVKTARTMLGHAYVLEGVIARGDQLGRTIGFPTANLIQVEQLLPAHGVYCGYACFSRDPADLQNKFPVTRIPGSAYPAAFNIGVRPTLGAAGGARIEAHVIGQHWPLDALYQSLGAFYFVERVRGEQKFSSLEGLKAAINDDIAFAKSVLRMV